MLADNRQLTISLEERLRSLFAEGDRGPSVYGGLATRASQKDPYQARSRAFPDAYTTSQPAPLFVLVLSEAELVLVFESSVRTAPAGNVQPIVPEDRCDHRTGLSITSTSTAASG